MCGAAFEDSVTISSHVTCPLIFFSCLKMQLQRLTYQTPSDGAVVEETAACRLAFSEEGAIGVASTNSGSL